MTILWDLIPDQASILNCALMGLWKKNLYSLWVAQFIAVAGLSMVVPFLPFYLKELGVIAREDVKIWSGLLFSAPFMVAAFLQPKIGRAHV